MDARVEQRLLDLETRLAFQERVLDELDDPLAPSNPAQDDLRVRMAAVLADLDSLRGLLCADPVPEPSPAQREAAPSLRHDSVCA